MSRLPGRIFKHYTEIMEFCVNSMNVCDSRDDHTRYASDVGIYTKSTGIFPMDS